MLRSIAIAGAAALAALTLPGTASAATLELGLAIDDSGSISNAQFLLQRNAYVAALSDTTVVPLDGSVSIGVLKFSSGVTNVFTMQQITSANIGALISAISNMTHAGGSTNIAGAITSLTQQIFSNSIVSDRQVIDVSTDGFNNVGNLAAARAAALAAGIDQINCIGIGSDADCSDVQAGSGAFSMNATFDNFETSLKTQIKTEVKGAVPEPSTWMMMILGFGTVGYAMRRRRVPLARQAV
jgi:hypothetical protein